MILTGHSLCLPSVDTVQELFSVARDANVVPDISLDPVLSTFLSLDSSAALQHQYAFIQRSLNGKQQTAFTLNVTDRLGGSRVAYGGVGVVALALSLLFDQVAQQVRAQGPTEGLQSDSRSQAQRIFGISTSSRIGWIIHRYLHLIPGFANDKEKMGETTELFDNWLKLELLDHYERMTTKKRMSTMSMQQWLAGAAIHLHVRIHQVRLNSVPLGSAESLRHAYKSGLSRLVQDYRAYLRRNIHETAAQGPGKPRTRTSTVPRYTNTFSITNVSCLFNDKLLSISTDEINKTTTPDATADIHRMCDRSIKDFGLNVPKRRGENTAGMENKKTLNGSAGLNSSKDPGVLGLLVIEPLRNVSHNVQHHPCESPAIQEALVTRIINAQDLERNRKFFQYPERVFHSQLRQRDDFEL